MMRVLILTLYAALIAWVAMSGTPETGLAMAVVTAVVALAFRPAIAARAITGWARASIASRGA